MDQQDRCFRPPEHLIGDTAQQESLHRSAAVGCQHCQISLFTGRQDRMSSRVASDDLLALVETRLAIPTAFATGKLRVQASPFDLLRLGSFL